jgi:outer membrane lipoprotein-sorting protein
MSHRLAPAIFHPLSSILVLAMIGCEARERIPMYSQISARESMAALAERAHAVRSVSGEGTVTLTRAGGQSVRLDSAVVLEPPQRARVRAWKFGHAVFDMTLTPQGVWIVAPQDDEHRSEIMSAGGNTGRLTRQWLRLMSGLFDAPGVSATEHGDRLLVLQANADGTVMTCDVDRKTLTPRRYVLRDDRGVQRFSLALSRYADFGNGIVWPRRIEAISESGQILIDLRDVEINGDLPPAAFRPPARAEKLPENPS